LPWCLLLWSYMLLDLLFLSLSVRGRFWECEIPEAVVREDGSVRLASKAVDLAFNVQPESSSHGWNVRGLGNNAWYRESFALPTM